MNFDVIVTSIPVVKYNIHYYDGDTKVWKRTLEEITTLK